MLFQLLENVFTIQKIESWPDSLIMPPGKNLPQVLIITFQAEENQSPPGSVFTKTFFLSRQKRGGGSYEQFKV